MHHANPTQAITNITVKTSAAFKGGELRRRKTRITINSIVPRREAHK